jgi:hypothetical protein
LEEHLAIDRAARKTGDAPQEDFFLPFFEIDKGVFHIC